MGFFIDVVILISSDCINNNKHYISYKKCVIRKSDLQLGQNFCSIFLASANWSIALRASTILGHDKSGSLSRASWNIFRNAVFTSLRLSLSIKFSSDSGSLCISFSPRWYQSVILMWSSSSSRVQRSDDDDLTEVLTGLDCF